MWSALEQLLRGDDMAMHRWIGLLIAFGAIVAAIGCAIFFFLRRVWRDSQLANQNGGRPATFVDVHGIRHRKYPNGLELLYVSKEQTTVLANPPKADQPRSRKPLIVGRGVRHWTPKERTYQTGSGERVAG